MTRSTASALAFLLLLPTISSAGKLGRAREQVRQPAPPAPAAQDNDDDDGGRLASARREVRQERRSQRRDEPRRQRRRGRRSVGGPSFGGPSFGGSSFGVSWWAPLDYTYSCPPPAPVACYPAPVVVSQPVVCEPVVVVPPPVVESPGYNPPPVFEAPGVSFAAAPYADGCSGCLFTSAPGARKWWSGQVRFSLGDAGDGVDRSGVGFLLEESNGFGVDFDWDTFTEELPSGDHDELHLGQVNFLYRVVETERALVRVGLGIAWLGDRYATDGGVNFTVRADLFPRRPWVVSTEIDLGTLGDAQTLHAAATAGVMLGPCELYGGYDYRRIGEVDLQGPMAGLRVWW